MQTAAKGSIADSMLSTAARRLKSVIEHKLPVPEEVIKDVLKLIKCCGTDELSALGLQPPPAPTLSQTSSTLPLQERLQAVQAVISSLHYNHTATYYYNVSKQRPLPAILSTAAGILRDPLPIKCIEAVFLGLLLTQGWEQGTLQRMPVGFKSMGANGQVYRHIVLAVHDPGSGCFGGLGISRRDNLMYKPLAFCSLAELIHDYIHAYSCWSHDVVKVRVGLPVEHDAAYTGPVCWRYCTINPQKRSWNSVASILNTHAAAAAQLQEKFKAATVGSCSSSSACMTPRSSVAKPHITRPYAGSPGSSSSSHVHASGTGVTPVGSPGLRSSRPGLEVSVHVAPPAAAATGVGRFRSPMSPSRRSPDTTSSRGQQGSDLQRDGGNSSTHQHSLSPAPGNACMARKLQLPFHGDGGGSGGGGMTIADGDDDSSSDEADGAMSVCTFDSDSEVNMFVDSMRHQQVCLAGTDFQSPRRKAAHAS